MVTAIIGGSGTYGHEALKQLYGHSDKIVIYSRDEYKQSILQETWPEYPDNIMRYRLGDVRDRERLSLALRGADFVILAAAMKRIEACERDPVEAYKTIVVGALNTIDACIDNKVKKCLFLSTDKSVNPCGIYGSCKNLAEKMIIKANDYGLTKFSAVRYANVYGSRGSVIETWKHKMARGDSISITEPEATRMFLQLGSAVKFTLDRLLDMDGQEIFIPPIDFSSSLADMLPTKDFTITGFRCAEKLNEELMTEDEERRAYQCDDYHIIYPASPQQRLTKRGIPVNAGTHLKLRSDHGLSRATA